MTIITLNILAEDIKTTCYSNPWDCAITRAFRRCGFKFRHAGIGIKYQSTYIDEHEVNGLAELGEKVLNMYKGTREVVDFQHVLIFPDEYDYLFQNTSKDDFVHPSDVYPASHVTWDD